MGDSAVILPLVVLVGGAFLTYMVARFITRRNTVLAGVTTIIFLTSFILTLKLHIQMREISSQSALPRWGSFEQGAAYLQADPGAILLSEIALGLSVLVSIYSGRYLALDKRYQTYYPLLLLLNTGLIGMVFATDLFNLYLFCELMSISTYVLVAFRRHTDTAVEAGYKYLIMGSVGTTTLLLGISFIFRATGVLSLPIVNAMDSLAGRIGLGCMMVGLGIKSAVVPLHTWLPDAHGRAPSSISTLLSGIVIQSAFYALLKVSLSLGLPANRFGVFLMGIAILNMFVGNTMAMGQRHTKRLLAFSTVAQMGYILFAIGVGLRHDSSAAVHSGFFLLTAHAGMKGLAFLCKGIYHFTYDVSTLDQLHGLAWNLPVTAICFAIAVAGLSGLPPLAGFVGKWLVLTETLAVADIWIYTGLFLFLSNTLIALGYYLPLIIGLFAPIASTAEPVKQISHWLRIPVIILACIVILMGILPNPWLRWSSGVGSYLLSIGR